MRSGAPWAENRPRTLSRSAVTLSSSASSAPIKRSKKLVGGSCLPSPTTTTCLPRAIAPRASTGLTWLASSKTTRSKSRAPGSRKLAIESGLIMKTGLIAWMASPALRTSCRIGRCRRFFWISRLSTPS